MVLFFAIQKRQNIKRERDYMIKKIPQTIYLEKQIKDKLKYISYKTDKSQSKVISEVLKKHLEEEIRVNPGYKG